MLSPITIILARAGSKGIPGKNKMVLAGKPLYEWTLQQLNEVNGTIAISTDDEDIKNALRTRQNIVIVDRPSSISSDTSTSEEALIHAIFYIESYLKDTVDTIIFPQLTSPLRKEYDFRCALQKYYIDKEEKNIDALFSASLLDDACIWNDKLKPISYDPHKRGRRQDRKSLYLENGSIYITSKKTLLKYNNRLGKRNSVYLMDSWQSLELDSPEDIDLIEFYLRKKGI